LSAIRTLLELVLRVNGSGPVGRPSVDLRLEKEGRAGLGRDDELPGALGGGEVAQVDEVAAVPVEGGGPDETSLSRRPAGSCTEAADVDESECCTQAISVRSLREIWTITCESLRESTGLGISISFAFPLSLGDGLGVIGRGESRPIGRTVEMMCWKSPGVMAVCFEVVPFERDEARCCIRLNDERSLGECGNALVSTVGARGTVVAMLLEGRPEKAVLEPGDRDASEGDIVTLWSCGGPGPEESFAGEVSETSGRRDASNCRSGSLCTSPSNSGSRTVASRSLSR
jgi:hypothetical protein